MAMPDPTGAALPAPCDKCGKPAAVCICDRVQPVETRLRVVILQHPQEEDALLGTARLVAVTLPQTLLRVGLSWSSLDHALQTTGADPDRWAVLATAKLPPGAPAPDATRPVILLDRRGKPRDPARARLQGILVLDGSWSQAKTLWWRNPWLLKLPRLALWPREPSMYGKALRREPRREYVSTLEAIADVLPALGEPEAVRSSLRRLLRTLLQRVRDQGGA